MAALLSKSPSAAQITSCAENSLSELHRRLSLSARDLQLRASDVNGSQGHFTSDAQGDIQWQATTTAAEIKL